MSCFFGLEVTVGQPQTVIPEIGFLHVSQAAIAAPKACKATLKVCVEGKTFAVGTLSPSDGIYHMPLDMNFMPDSEVRFSVEGDGDAKVHLTGYYELDDDEDAEDCLGDDAQLGSEDVSDDEEDDESDADSSADAGAPKADAKQPPQAALESGKKGQPAVAGDNDSDSSESESSDDSEEGDEEEDEEEEEAEEVDTESGSDEEDDSESEEADMPRKKHKGQSGAPVQTRAHGNGGNKGFQKNQGGSAGDNQRFGKPHGDNTSSRGGFKSGNFNGGNRFGEHRGGHLSPHRGNQGSRGGRFDRGGNRGGRFDRGGSRGGQFNRGGSRGGRFDRGGSRGGQFDRGGKRGGFRGRQ